MDTSDRALPGDARDVYDAIPLPVTVFTASGEYVYLNAAAVDVLGDVTGRIDADALIGRRWQDLFPAQRDTAFGATFDRVALNDSIGREWVTVPEYRSRAGSEWTARMRRDPQGLVHVMSIRKRDDGVADAGLRRVIQDFPFGACVVFDRDLRYISASGRGLEEVGLASADLVGRTLDELWSDDVLEILKEPCLAAFEGRDSDVLVPWRDYVYRIWVSSIRDSAGEPLAGVFLTLNVTEEAELTQQLDLVRHSLDALDQGVTVSEAGGNGPIIYASAGFERLTGYGADEYLGRNQALLHGPDTDPEALARIDEEMRHGRSAQEVLLNYRRDGSTFWNRFTVSPMRGNSGEVTHFVGTHEDVTSHRRLGQELERSRRLNALGRLAGGLAHDMRNVLTSSTLLIDLHRNRTDVPDELLTDLDEIWGVLQQGTSITERLLTFAHDRSETPEHIELVSFAEDRRRLLRTLLRESIEIRVSADDGPLWVEGNESQLDQALMNLSKNAEEAMPEGGVLTVRVLSGVNMEELAPHIPTGAERLKGRWGGLTVSDTGHGMPPDVRAHAFEPFFTTRQDKGGTGLGLASVYGVVQAMRGICWIESTEGEGSHVHLAFPLKGEPEPTPDVHEHDPRSVVGGLRILLAEDERGIRTACERHLARAGAKVHAAADGREAARAFDEAPEMFDLLVTDAVMPEMSGPELLAHVRGRAPTFPAVLVSGYHEFSLPDEYEGLVRLSKPFSMGELTRAIAEALEAARRMEA